MKTLEAVANGAKDLWLKASDLVEGHPHVALMLIIGLALVAVIK